MPDRDPRIREQLLHSIKVLTRATVALFIAVAVVSVLGYFDSAKQRDAIQSVQQDTVATLCTFRADLQRRHDDGVEFLEENPDGIPGLPAETIQQSIDNQQRTLTSLAGLPCGEVPDE